MTDEQSAVCITGQHQVATFSIDVLSKKKISFQNRFSSWADVFQIPNFIKPWPLAATQTPMPVTLRIVTVCFIVFHCFTSCGQTKNIQPNYSIDKSLSLEIEKKIKLFNKHANSNISFTIYENDKIIVTSKADGEPGLCFSSLIDKAIGLDCLNGVEDGFGFTLVISEDTLIIKFKIASNSDKVKFRLLNQTSSQPEILVSCKTRKIVFSTRPLFKTGEIIQGKVELESDSFYENTLGQERKLRFNLTSYFMSEPLPIIDKKYKTLDKQN